MDYHQDRFEDFSLLIFKENNLFALLPTNRLNDTVFSHQGLTYGSFILQERAKLLDTIEAFKEVLKFLFENKIYKLNFKIIPPFYNILPSDELEYIFFITESKLIKRDVLMVIYYNHNLGFQKNRREGINKAIRHGLYVVEDGNFDDFWNHILIPNLKSKHQVNPVHTLMEIKKLATKFPNNIKQINVYKNTTIVAGTTLFLTDTTVHPQYVSGNLKKNDLGSIDLLYDFVIENYKNNRSYFDFNISSEEEGTVLNKGLLFWKESCGARSFVANTYEVKTEAFKKLVLNLK